MNAVPALLAAALAFAPVAAAAEENAPGAAGAPPTVAVGRPGERGRQARRRDGQPVDRGREADRRRGGQRERAPRRGGDRRAEGGRRRRQGHRHRRPLALSGLEQQSEPAARRLRLSGDQPHRGAGSADRKGRRADRPGGRRTAPNTRASASTSPTARRARTRCASRRSRTPRTAPNSMRAARR